MRSVHLDGLRVHVGLILVWLSSRFHNHHSRTAFRHASQNHIWFERFCDKFHIEDVPGTCVELEVLNDEHVQKAGRQVGEFSLYPECNGLPDLFGSY